MTKYNNISDFIPRIKTNQSDLGEYLSILYEFTKMDDSTKTATSQSTPDLLSVPAVKWTRRGADLSPFAFLYFPFCSCIVRAETKFINFFRQKPNGSNV